MKLNEEQMHLSRAYTHEIASVVQRHGDQPEAIITALMCVATNAAVLAGMSERAFMSEIVSFWNAACQVDARGSSAPAGH